MSGGIVRDQDTLNKLHEGPCYGRLDDKPGRTSVHVNTFTVSKKLPTIWPAEPHTVVKITILRSYLNAWFRILGQRMKNQTILYVDGFAGPGRYINGVDGSPVAALQAAKATIAELGAGFIAKEIHCAFIEKDVDRHRVLQEEIAGYVGTPRLGLSDFGCDFTEGIERLRSKVPGPFQGQGPLFVFADPFGGTQIPFRVFARCMEGPASELLINLDVDGIGRIFLGRNPGWQDQLTELFGNESWRGALQPNASLAQLSLSILELYKSRMRTLPEVKYLWSFAMLGAKDKINYHLVFASKHRLGLLKMKEAMRLIDKTGAYLFSDAHVNQHTLFRADDDEHYAELLWRAFHDRSVPYAAVDLWALNESPFLNPKSMLWLLEEQERVVAEVTPGLARKKGDFPEEKIAALRFGNFGSRMRQTDLF